jgi:flagellar biosynthetic protein FlhB
MAKDDKTEEPTGTRRRKAKEDGSIAYSQQVASTASLVASVVVLAWVLTKRGGFREFMARLLDTGISSGEPDLILIQAINQTALYFFLLVGPILAAAWFGALAGNVVQGLPNYTTKALEPKFDKFNPIKNLEKFKTKASPAEWARVLVLLGVLIFVLWEAMVGNWDELLRTPGVSIAASNALLRAILIRVLTYVLITLVLLAIADFFIQRQRYEKGLKMSKSEVKQDNKQTDGNPEIKGKIRQKQQEQAKQRMMAAVQDADVIITNPTHFAVALAYKPESMGAPRVVAKGQNWLAQKIKQVGRENDIPQVENVPLARALYRSVEVEQEIPLQLYKAVAEVLAFVFRARNRMKNNG